MEYYFHYFFADVGRWQKLSHVKMTSDNVSSCVMAFNHFAVHSLVAAYIVHVLQYDVYCFQLLMRLGFKEMQLLCSRHQREELSN